MLALLFVFCLDRAAGLGTTIVTLCPSLRRSFAVSPPPPPTSNILRFFSQVDRRVTFLCKRLGHDQVPKLTSISSKNHNVGYPFQL